MKGVSLGTDPQAGPVVLVSHPSEALLEWVRRTAAGRRISVVSTPEGADHYRANGPAVPVLGLDRARGLGGVAQARKWVAEGGRPSVVLAGSAQGRPPTLPVLATALALPARDKGVLYEDGTLRLVPARRFPLLALRVILSDRGNLFRAGWRLWLLAGVYARLALFTLRRLATTMSGGRG